MTDAVVATHGLLPGTAVEVSVPATSANLGPGFDTFGLALDWRDTVSVEVIESGIEVEVSGEGADAVPRDASHLIVTSVLTGLAELGVTAPGLRLIARNTIPHGRGLGSSSAAIVAGLTAARALAGRALDPGWVTPLATRIEGHPDNVAAAAVGGFTLAYQRDQAVHVVAPPVLASISGLVLVPQTEVATRRARGLLPATVPHADAAANAAAAALLVHALARDPALLFDATQDRLHQDYRRSAMPTSHDLVRHLRAEGHAAVISGAGPTVLVLGRPEDLPSPDVAEGFAGRTVHVGRGAAVESGPEGTTATVGATP